MRTQKGNQLWRLRSTHGRKKLFETPELLWEAACRYFEWCDTHPWYRKEVIKAGRDAGKIIEIPTERPYSITGLQIFLGVSSSYWRDFRAANHTDFSSIISDIEKIIETQQFEGATVGAFNANIIARKLGLADRQNISTPEGESININTTVESHRVIFENYNKQE